MTTARTLDERILAAVKAAPTLNDGLLAVANLWGEVETNRVRKYTAETFGELVRLYEPEARTSFRGAKGDPLVTVVDLIDAKWPVTMEVTR